MTHPRVTHYLLLLALLTPPLLSELVLAIAPGFVVYALYGAAATLIQSRGLLLPSKRRLAGALALVGALLCLHLVPWNSRKVFLARFDKIEKGMSVEQVHALLAPVSISPERQTDLTARGYRHSGSPRFDADIGVVRFASGRVISTQFLPD